MWIVEGKALWCVVDVLRRSVERFPNSNRETVTRKPVAAVPRWTVGTTSPAQRGTGPGFLRPVGERPDLPGDLAAQR